MLNGKFYTGLPPNMIDRGGAGRNRLESHLFWPDDTKKETATEARLKRRSSFQYGQNDSKPQLQKQMSWNNSDDVDTRKMFANEFSKSSIRFCDNIHEEPAEFNQTTSRNYNKFHNKKTTISAKPTATKLELPDNDATNEYILNKKKQAFESKIHFYDYDDIRDKTNAGASAKNQRNNNNNNSDNLNNNNNSNLIRRPKMDMNNKKEMEKNTKNSPKLQVKGTVRNLQEMAQGDKANLRNEQNNNVSRDAAPRNSVNFKVNNRHLEDAKNSYPSIHDSRPIGSDISPKRILKGNTNYGDDFQDNNAGYYHEPTDHDFGDLDRDMREMRLARSPVRRSASPPKKHVTYNDEAYAPGGRTGRYYYEDDDANIRNFDYRRRDEEYRATIASAAAAHNRFRNRINPNMSTGSNMIEEQQHQEQKQRQYNQRQYPQQQPPLQRPRMNARDIEADFYDAECQPDSLDADLGYVAATETPRSAANRNRNNNNNHKGFNNQINNQINYDNNDANYYNDNEEIMTTNHERRRLNGDVGATRTTATVKPTAAPRTKTTNSTTATTSANPQRHLRSNLGFHNGEIIANDDGNDGNANNNNNSNNNNNNSKAAAPATAVRKPPTLSRNNKINCNTNTNSNYNNNNNNNIKNNNDNNSQDKNIHKYRRTARNAATQRVSVGLPD